MRLLHNRNPGRRVCPAMRADDRRDLRTRRTTRPEVQRVENAGDGVRSKAELDLAKDQPQNRQTERELGRRPDLPRRFARQSTAFQGAHQTESD